MARPADDARLSRHTRREEQALHRPSQRPTYLEGIAASAVNDRIYGQTAVVLFRTNTHDGPTISLTVSDDVEAQSDDIDGIRLMIEFEHWAPDDRVEVSLDGAVLGEPEIRDAAALSGDPADVSENKVARVGPYARSGGEGGPCGQGRPYQPRLTHRRAADRQYRRRAYQV